VLGDLRDERDDASEVREGSDEGEEGSCDIPGVGGVCKPSTQLLQQHNFVSACELRILVLNVYKRN
jgi:hypothetical protein